MKKQRTWNILNKCQTSNAKSQMSNSSTEEIIKIILGNRGLSTKKEIEEFLHPDIHLVTPESVKIDLTQLAKTVERIHQAIERKEKIVVFGDYDVDGITGTAILWETLHALGAQTLPYIPHRIDEGYGLSVRGIENVIQNLFQDPKKIPDQVENGKKMLIITVDNGIVAHEAVDFANKQGIEVIITDHHTTGDTLPNAYAIVHTTKLCGAGVAWVLSKEIKSLYTNIKSDESEHLDLVSLATVADIVPLTGANRAVLKAGLPFLRKTKRLGLKELFLESGIKPEGINVYHIGHIIGPRLNAMGRMESAMDSLRLLCTKDRVKAHMLAAKLGITNRERQLVTQSASLHAIETFKSQNTKVKSLLFIADEAYEEGVIGLVAGKLVEEFYRPAIVISKREKLSKASARSIAGFNIIEFIRSASEHLVNAGGHPMAAGFTVETEKISLLQETLEQLAETQLTPDTLTPILKIDCEIPLSFVSQDAYDAIQTLGPFGMANPEPVFVSRGVEVVDVRSIGRDRSHLKLVLSNHDSRYDAIAFGMGELVHTFKPGQKVDIAYTIDENEWNGRKNLQLKIKDIQ